MAHISAVPAPTRFVLWALAFAIDLGTPWAAVQHTVRVPTDAAHLPERFGLFTLILLGESVVAVLQGMESQYDWTPVAAPPVSWHRRSRRGHSACGDGRPRDTTFSLSEWTLLSAAVGTIGLAMVTIVTNTVRCVQEAEDGTARTLLQTLTLPSEDADILK